MIKNWCINKSKLTLNTEKNVRLHFCLKIYVTPAEPPTFLGVILDHALTWEAHAENLY